MPDISASVGFSVKFVVVCNIDFLEYPFRGGNLVRTHHHQHSLAGEYAILGEDVQQGMLGEECLGEIHQVVDYLVVAVCPETVALVSVSGFHSTPSGQYCCINLSNLLMFSFCQVLRFPLKFLPLHWKFSYEWLRRSSNLF